MSMISNTRCYRICSRCVMDTTDPDIIFYEHGHCNHCTDYFNRLKFRPTKMQQGVYLNAFLNKVKQSGIGNKYDCIIGLSGGYDSSFLAYKVVEFGLRPLVLHFDSGWNTEMSVRNIGLIIKDLNVDLYTIVCDWDEMRSLQRSFFKASLVNCDIPQDHAFIAALYMLAAEQDIKYWISGHDSWGSEGIMPPAWRGYDSRDWKHIKNINKLMGDTKLANYPHFTLFDHFIKFPYIKGIKNFSLLSYINYKKTEANTFLKNRIYWKDYKGKHNESILTRFFQGYYLPEKFGYDKRRAHLSSLIVSGQIKRTDAIEELEHPYYSPELLAEDMDFVLKKLGFSKQDWEIIMKTPPKTENDFPSNSIYFDLEKYTHFIGSKIKRNILRMLKRT